MNTEPHMLGLLPCQELQNPPKNAPMSLNVTSALAASVVSSPLQPPAKQELICTSKMVGDTWSYGRPNKLDELPAHHRPLVAVPLVSPTISPNIAYSTSVANRSLAESPQ